ncbi:hypothetical protein [Dokdonella sp.]|uniref:hypothetical protein n=1 Tax=Dokdonella sp. TaxID=2291710 RepID=UPI0031C19A4D|nr:hypothetical protein [Dokdonella sp.]
MTTAQPELSPAARGGILALLAVVMLATRIHHFGALPDASWLVFFAGGFYLRHAWRWALPLLLALAVLIDYAVISGQGLNFWNHYCVSPAYWFLAPAYGAMWLGGAWLARRYRGLGMRELGLLAGSVLVSASLCYLVSNGSFYWLSPAVATPNIGGWMKNLGDWYVPYLGTSLIYAAVGAALHAASVLAARELRGATARGARLGHR